MRARLESIWRSGRWPEALALLAGAIVVVVAVAALRGTGRSHGSRDPIREPSPRSVTAVGFAHSPSGATGAATTYLGLLAETAASGKADERMSAMTTGALRSQLEQGLPVLAHILRARLASSAAPCAFDGWPLGYRVMRFSAARATVSVWHLDVAASSTVGLMTTDYATTTYDVRWVAGSWHIDQARTVRGPTPPPPNASLPVVDRFATAVRAFARYRYAP
jgi:hypothetical protein